MLFRAAFRPLSLAALFAASVLALSGCAAKDDAFIDEPVDQLYNGGMSDLTDHDWVTAAKEFDEVDRQHPNSVWATKAQLMSAYALYQNNKFDDAVAALDRFIQLHPGHKDVAYAYYLKGLCFYEQITDVERDQKVTEEADSALQETVDRFPDSKYARDARFKLDLIRDHLAGREMSIGRFYQQQKEWLAAINRYRTVVDQYQTTPQVPEALHRLVECYEALGLTEEAQKAAAVLGYNYPGSSWYKDSYDVIKDVAADAVAAKTPPQAQAAPPVITASNAGSDTDKESGWFNWLPNIHIW